MAVVFFFPYSPRPRSNGRRLFSRTETGWSLPSPCFHLSLTLAPACGAFFSPPSPPQTKKTGPLFFFLTLNSPSGTVDAEAYMGRAPFFPPPCRGRRKETPPPPTCPPFAGRAPLFFTPLRGRHQKTTPLPSSWGGKHHLAFSPPPQVLEE